MGNNNIYITIIIFT